MKTSTTRRNLPSSQTETLSQHSPTAATAGHVATPPTALGKRLRAARLAANQTQNQLAGERYSKSYLSAVEHGKLTPSFQALGFLAARLGLPISYFLGERVQSAHSPESAGQHPQERAERLRSDAEELIQMGWYEQAETFLHYHLRESQQSDDSFTTGVLLGALVSLNIARGTFAEAQNVAQEAMAVTQASQDYHTAGLVQLALVTVYAAAHDEEGAEEAFQAALRLLDTTDEPEMLSQAHEQYGHFLAARKRYQEAYEQLEAAQQATQRERSASSEV